MFNSFINAPTEHASVEYNRIALSESIFFDAVTIKLPIKKTQLSATGGKIPRSANYSICTKYYCSREAA